jgi:hypothetical protein
MTNVWLADPDHKIWQDCRICAVPLKGGAKTSGICKECKKRRLVVLAGPVEGDPTPSNFVVLCSPYFAEFVRTAGFKFDWENYIWRTDDEEALRELFYQLDPYLVGDRPKWPDCAGLLEVSIPSPESPGRCVHGAVIDPKVVCIICARVSREANAARRVDASAKGTRENWRRV